MDLNQFRDKLNLGNRKIVIQPFVATYPGGTAAGASFTLQCVPDKSRMYALIGFIGQTQQGTAHRISRIISQGTTIFYGAPVLASAFFNSNLPNGTFLFPGAMTFEATGIKYRNIGMLVLGANPRIEIEGTVAAGATGNFGTTLDNASVAAVLIDITDIVNEMNAIRQRIGPPNFLNVQVPALTGGAGSSGSVNGNTQSNNQNGRVSWSQLVLQRMDNTAGGPLAIPTDFFLSINVAQRREQQQPYQGKLPARTLGIVPNAAAGENANGLPTGFLQFNADFGETVQMIYDQVGSPGTNASTVDMMLCGFEYYNA